MEPSLVFQGDIPGIEGGKGIKEKEQLYQLIPIPTLKVHSNTNPSS